MKDTVYLIFDQGGVSRMVKNDPSTLKPGERAIQVLVQVDDAIFRPPQVAKITITVPADAVIAPVQVESTLAVPGSGLPPGHRGLGGR